MVSPGSSGPNRFDAAVLRYDSGEALRPDAVSLRFQVADRPDLPAATLELAREPDWHFRGAGLGLSAEGRWTITALVQTPTDSVEVPMQLATSATSAAAVCGEGTSELSYSVAVDSDPDPPKADGTTVRLVLRDGDMAVTGAKVCVRLDMPDMGHPGISAVAKEVSSGKYEARIRFSMTGGWIGSAVIALPGKPAALVTLRLEVT